jgi:hypothetical protein
LLLQFHLLVCNLKETSISNVIGNDGVSSNMLLNCNDNFINSKLIFFYKYIFKYGVIPKGLNITHIRPIIKDKSLSCNDLNNLRPISISNVLAQIFERLLGYSLNEIKRLIKINLVINQEPLVHMHYLYLKKQLSNILTLINQLLQLN